MTRRTSPRGRRGRSDWPQGAETGSRGSVLILTVWVISLLSFLAAALGSQGISSLGLTDRLEEQLRVRSALLGGVEFAKAAMSTDPSAAWDLSGEKWLRLEDWLLVKEAEVMVNAGPGLTAEDGKINLNTAPEDVLENLFLRVGVLPEEALRISQSIMDWRDEDDEERSEGAEDFVYRALEKGYACKNGPFESLEELFLVRGMTPEIWKRCSPFLTVHGSGRLNVNTASGDTLICTGLSPEAAAAILAYRMGGDGAEGTPDDRAFADVQQLVYEMSNVVSTADLNVLNHLKAADFLGVRSEAFGLSLEGWLSSPDRATRIDCVLDRSGRVLAWREA